MWEGQGGEKRFKFQTQRPTLLASCSSLFFQTEGSWNLDISTRHSADPRGLMGLIMFVEQHGGTKVIS